MSHAHAILLREDGLLAGSADPRGDGFAATW
jgi:gamma-glutamyltranspeptidase